MEVGIVKTKASCCGSGCVRRESHRAHDNKHRRGQLEVTGPFCHAAGTCSSLMSTNGMKMAKKPQIFSSGAACSTAAMHHNTTGNSRSLTDLMMAV